MERHLPKKMSELGRIRIGDQEKNSSGKGTHPHKLETFRLTSSNKPLLHFAANLYGGEVRPWVGERAPDGQFELYTTVNAIDVLVPTARALTVQYELWSGSGCLRRCDGNFITHCPLQESLQGTECQCPEDDIERADQAKDGKACARVARLNVILPDLPGMGVWRLDTKGFYATAELLGALEMLEMANHQIIEASLRLEQRLVKRFVAGKDGNKNAQSTTMKFSVPVLWPKFTPRQMLAAADQRILLMESPPSMRELSPGASAADDLYGEGGGDVLRAETTRQRINTTWRDYGLTEQEITRYWDKQTQRLHQEPHQMGQPTLARLLHEAEKWIAAHPRAEDAPLVEEAGPTDDGTLDALPLFAEDTTE